MIPDIFRISRNSIISIGEVIAVLVLLVALFIVPSCVAYRMGWSNRDHQVTLEASQARFDELLTAAAFSDFNTRIAGDYVLRRAETRTVYETIRVEVPRVVTHYVRVPGAAPEPVPACVFTGGFVRVWNSAVQGDARSAAGTPAGAAAAVSRSGPAQAEADLYDSGLGLVDVLDNQVANAESCAVIRDRCRSLQRWASGLNQVGR